MLKHVHITPKAPVNEGGPAPDGAAAVTDGSEALAANDEGRSPSDLPPAEVAAVDAPIEVPVTKASKAPRAMDDFGDEQMSFGFGTGSAFEDVTPNKTRKYARPGPVAEAPKKATVPAAEVDAEAPAAPAAKSEKRAKPASSRTTK
jgi:hypothetical protein